MNPNETTSAHLRRESESLEDLCRRADEAVQEAKDKPPEQAEEEVDIAERALVRLRDELIGRLRRAPDAPEAADRRHALEQTNIALSLIVGIEYPVAAFQRKLLDSAHEVIQKLRGSKAA